MALSEIMLSSGGHKAVSIHHVMETGLANPSVRVINHCKIDLSQHEASTVQAVDSITSQVLADAKGNAELQQLLHQPAWDKPKRERYEQLISDTIAKRSSEHPLLKSYRADTDDQKNEPSDITHLTTNDPLDCKRMSTIRGIITQRVEDKLLPHEGKGLKKAQDYYLAGGIGIDGPNPADSHQVIISSATGNLIQATANRDPYIRSRYNYGFGDFVAGVPFVGDYTEPNGSPHADFKYVFGASSLVDGATLRAREKAFHQGDAHRLAELSSSDLPPGNITITGLLEGEALHKARSGCLGEFDAVAKKMINTCHPDTQMDILPPPPLPSRGIQTWQGR